MNVTRESAALLLQHTNNLDSTPLSTKTSLCLPTLTVPYFQVIFTNKPQFFYPLIVNRGHNCYVADAGSLLSFDCDGLQYLPQHRSVTSVYFSLHDVSITSVTLGFRVNGKFVVLLETLHWQAIYVSLS